MISFDMEGFRAAFDETVDQVLVSVDERGLRAVGSSGASIFRDQAKRNALAHKKTGLLDDSIIIKRLEEESDANVRQVYLVTVRKGRVVGEGAYYRSWVEKGHKFVPRNKNVSEKTGKKVGWKAHRLAAELEYGTASAPAYPFMRPAYMSHRQEAADMMTKTLKYQIRRATEGQ